MACKLNNLIIEVVAWVATHKLTIRPFFLKVTPFTASKQTGQSSPSNCGCDCNSRFCVLPMPDWFHLLFYAKCCQMRQSKQKELQLHPPSNTFRCRRSCMSSAPQHLQIASLKCLTFLEAKEIGIIGLALLLSSSTLFFPGVNSLVDAIVAKLVASIGDAERNLSVKQIPPIHLHNFCTAMYLPCSRYH